VVRYDARVPLPAAAVPLPSAAAGAVSGCGARSTASAGDARAGRQAGTARRWGHV